MTVQATDRDSCGTHYTILDVAGLLNKDVRDEIYK